LFDVSNPDNGLEQGPPRFAALARLFHEDRKAQTQHQKSWRGLLTTLAEIEGRAVDLQRTIERWATVHLDNANNEIHAAIDGIRGMLERRRMLLDQIDIFIDALDDNHGEEGTREEMLAVLIELAEHGPASAAATSNPHPENPHSRSRPDANLTLAKSASPTDDHR
jgi:hypothetical protein